MGWNEIPILIELQQDDRTVCCGHTIVELVLGVQWLLVGADCEIFYTFIVTLLGALAVRLSPC